MRRAAAPISHQDLCESLLPCPTRFVTAIVNNRLSEQQPKTHVILSGAAGGVEESASFKRNGSFDSAYGLAQDDTETWRVVR